MRLLFVRVSQFPTGEPVLTYTSGICNDALYKSVPVLS